MSFSIRNFSLRTKLIICLLGTTLMSTALVGGIAYVRLTEKFDDLVMQEAVRRFRADVSDYFRAYGSWEAGHKQESFRTFSQRRHALLGHVPGELGMGRLDPPRGPVLPGMTPDSLAMAPLSRDHPPPPPADMQGPPFRFYLFDNDFHALLPLPPYKIGQRIRPEDVKRLSPIESEGRIVAHFLPQGKPNYSALDLGYIAAMREALIISILAGTVLTLVFGIGMAAHLNRRLRKLTRAVKAMGQGELGKQVTVEANDEVGILATAFNRMSKDLERQYRELQESKDRIEKMAIQLRELSIRDALTGLYNRRYFDENCARLFQHAVRYQRPFSVMLADIDHFKKINDSFSHAMGDEVLRRIGEILNSKTRATDLVARYGGEEFVIAFPEASLQQAEETCEALRQRIEAYPWHEVHPDLKVTISIGLSSDARVKSFNAMLEAADTLLYRAKHGGRNQVCSSDKVITLPQDAS